MTYTTLADIHANCDEVGDCLLWRGSLSDHGYPMYGNPRVYLRRIVFELAGGIMRPRMRLTTKCGERKCLHHKCIKPASHSVLAELAHKDVINRQKWRANLAAAARINSALKWDDICAIRASEETAPALAVRYGVSPSTIYRIQKFAGWQDFTNPFLGLVA